MVGWWCSCCVSVVCDPLVYVFALQAYNTGLDDYDRNDDRRDGRRGNNNLMIDIDDNPQVKLTGHPAASVGLSWLPWLPEKSNHNSCFNQDAKYVVITFSVCIIINFCYFDFLKVYLTLWAIIRHLFLFIFTLQFYCI